MSQYTDLVASDGAVAHWQFNDNAASTTVVATLGGVNGTLNGGDNTSVLSSTTVPAGIGGRSLHLNGSDDYISIPDSTTYEPSSHSSMTFEAWVNLDTKQIQSIFYKLNEYFINIGEGGGTDQFYAKTGDIADYGTYQYKIDNTTRSTGTWYHVAVQYSSATINIYINGTLNSTNTFTGTGVPPGTSNILRIGAEVGSRFFDGYISNPAIYHTVLDSTTIAKHYRVGAGIDTYVYPTALAATFAITAPAVVITNPSNATIAPTALALTLATTAPVVKVGVTQAPTAVAVTWGVNAPTVKAYTLVTSVSYDGVIQPWVSTPASNSSSKYANTLRYGVNAGTATNTMQIALFDDATIPSNCINPQVVVAWEYVTGADLGLYGLYDDFGSFNRQGPFSGTGTATSHLGLSYTASVPYLTRVNISPFINGGTGSAYVQVNSLTLTYEALIPLTSISVTAPAITFTANAPTIFAANTTTVVAPSPPAITFGVGLPNIAVNGGIAVGINAGVNTWTAGTPVVGVVSHITQIVTNLGVVTLDVNVPNIVIRADNLSFLFIDGGYNGSTARDTTAIGNQDLGAVLYNEDILFNFRLGNTSSIATNFVVSVTSANNLANMVTFSTDKVTYSSSISFDSVGPNGITDTIFMKLTPTDSAYISTGTFLIDVEQTDA